MKSLILLIIFAVPILAHGQIEGTYYGPEVYFHYPSNDVEKMGLKGKVKSFKMVVDKRNTHPGYRLYHFDRNQNLIQEEHKFPTLGTSFIKTNYYYGDDNVLDSTVNFNVSKLQGATYGEIDSIYSYDTDIFHYLNDTLIITGQMQSYDNGKVTIVPHRKYFKVFDSDSNAIEEFSYETNGDTIKWRKYEYTFKPKKHKILYKISQPDLKKKDIRVNEYEIFFYNDNKRIKKIKHKQDGKYFECRYFIWDNLGNITEVYRMWCKHNRYRKNELSEVYKYDYDEQSGNPLSMDYHYSFYTDRFYITYEIEYWD